MSLPKEPRQKMINMMYLVLTALLALNVSSEILNAFRVVDGSLKRSNANVSASTADIYNSFELALKNPEKAAKAAQYKPIADKIKAETETLQKVVDEYNKKIVDAAGGVDPKTGKLKKEDNLDIGTRIMEKEGGGEKLFAAIQTYKNNVKSLMGAEYNLAFPKGTPLEDETIKSGKDLAVKNFSMQPSVANLTMISKTLSDIKNTEAQAVKHLFAKIDGVVVRLNKFEPLVSTNATYLMPGEELVVSAGLGAFNDENKPQITIGGAGVATGPNGLGERKIQVQSSGSVPVTITYKDPNTGIMQSISKTVQYTVGTPGGASVSADKMNVFYIGVDNPVTIASGKGWDKTSVSMSGGSISGSNGRYTVRVSSEGMASVNVSMEGKNSSFPFRVKSLPPASAFVGTYKEGDMPAASLRAMGGVRAALENSEFDAPYRVVGYTITGSGAGFSGAVSAANEGGFWAGSAAAIANKAVPGSIISFSKITVVGPDGKPRKASNPSIVIRCM